MAGWLDGWIAGWLDGWMAGWLMDGLMDGCMAFVHFHLYDQFFCLLLYLRPCMFFSICKCTCKNFN